tara:strand:- start:133 stop:864 length:732 start_codon:yes stop_codon:yes gene_type:complete
LSIFTPENYREKILKDDIYGGLLTGDHARAATKTLLEPDYAFLYAQNLCQHLQRLKMSREGGLLDIGCGAGAITAGFYRLFPNPVYGIDMSPAAIMYAKKNFAGPEFIWGSADQLDTIENGSLAVVHAREFYPYSRTRDAVLHMRFLNAARPKLMTNGLFCVVQIRDPKVKNGLHSNLREIQAQALEAGFKRYGILVMTPQSFFGRFGALGQFMPIRLALTVAGKCLEFIMPGRVSYIYWFQA